MSDSRSTGRPIRSARSRLKRATSMLQRGIVTAYKAGPREATTLVVCGVIGGITPVAVAWFQKGLVDHFERAVPSGTVSWTPYVSWIAGLLVIVALAADISSSVRVFAMTALRDKIEGSIKARLFTRITRSKGLNLFEDPDQLDALNLAQQAIPRYQQLDNCFATLVLGFMGTVPAILVSATIAWWVPILLCVTVIPAAIMQFRLEGEVWNAEATLAGSRRRQHLVEETLTRPAFAKDVRLFSLGSLLIGRWTTAFQGNFAHLNRLRVAGLRKTIVLSTIGVLGVVVPLVYVVNGVVNGTESVGNLILFLGIGFSLRSGLQHLLWVSSQLAGIAMAISHFESFVTSAPTGEGARCSREFAAPLSRSLTLQDVSFTYPGASNPSLRDVSLEIARGTTIAIVGENGAGKSTLAKLLGRLYEPSTGSILWDGKDIATFDIDAWRDRLAFMAQDVAELPVTLHDYLGFSRPSNPPSEPELMTALTDVNLAAIASRSRLGLAAPLTKELPEGTQLSGGQWQRLTLARVALRATFSDLLILDEPTSAVDPAAEHSLITQILDLSKDRTAIIITHRLALCTGVDRVVVLHNGRIIADGNHADLLAQGGHYADMFRSQAHWYQ